MRLNAGRIVRIDRAAEDERLLAGREDEQLRDLAAKGPLGLGSRGGSNRHRTTEQRQGHDSIAHTRILVRVGRLYGGSETRREYRLPSRGASAASAQHCQRGS